MLYKTYEIHELSNKDYHNKKEYLGSSGIKDMLISPKYFKMKQEIGTETTPALLFGSQLHSYFSSIVLNYNDNENLYPEYNTYFNSEYKSLEELNAPFNPNTNTYYGLDTKKMTDFFVSMGITAESIINSENLKTIENIFFGREKEKPKDYKNTEPIINDIQFTEYIFNAKTEFSIFLENFLGIKVKIRIDLLNEFVYVNNKVNDKIILLDLKSTTQGNIDVDSFNKVIAERDYHIQASFYVDVYKEYRKLAGLPEKDIVWVWLAVEKTPPYDFNFIELSYMDYCLGQQEYTKAIEQYKWCLEHDKWQGIRNYNMLENGKRINKISNLPNYAINNKNFNN